MWFERLARLEGRVFVFFDGVSSFLVIFSVISLVIVFGSRFWVLMKVWVRLYRLGC